MRHCCRFEASTDFHFSVKAGDDTANTWFPMALHVLGTTIAYGLLEELTRRANCVSCKTKDLRHGYILAGVFCLLAAGSGRRQRARRARMGRESDRVAVAGTR